MDYVVRAVDVGFGNTKYISSVTGGDSFLASCRTQTPSQNPPVTLFPDWTPEGVLHLKTCRKNNSSLSALCRAPHKADKHSVVGLSEHLLHLVTCR